MALPDVRESNGPSDQPAAAQLCEVFLPRRLNVGAAEIGPEAAIRSLEMPLIHTTNGRGYPHSIHNFVFGPVETKHQYEFASGAGSQFACSSGPGDSFWMYRSMEASGLRLNVSRESSA